jgi:hypothetical protein
MLALGDRRANAAWKIELIMPTRKALDARAKRISVGGHAAER